MVWSGLVTASMLLQLCYCIFLASYRNENVLALAKLDEAAALRKLNLGLG